MRASNPRVDLAIRHYGTRSSIVLLFVTSLIVAGIGCGAAPENAAPTEPIGQRGDALRNNGNKILFRRQALGTPASTAQVWKMNPDGSDKQLVACAPTGATDVLGPAWSPDGQRALFYILVNGPGSISGLSPHQDMYLIGANASDCLDSTFVTEGRFPDWSPVKNRIVFDRGSSGERQVYVRYMDCTEPETCEAQLTYDDGTNPRNTRAAWSPDGSKIAFASANGCYCVTNSCSAAQREASLDIWVMNDDGSNPTRLTFDCEAVAGRGNNAPQWSPDGQNIVFQSTRDDDLELYLMNADGSGQMRLTYHPGTDANAKWSPEGDQIVFHRIHQGNLQLFLMRPECPENTCSGPQPVTGGDDTTNAFPAWASHLARLAH